ncbi:MAG: formylmethanofuran dehydrogenase subunit B [Candidatus Altiarchaeales archaeon WOR_SM1_86-2]|nr:MAG: formylmethanofuran dehydrogenase subunit B [Candidatus Altiarchaeales archaeon WOR_SM1_86-2]ODS40824.1 MAG: formylmethanofuran dehydrogenase subunit B [Candidatus Altiarchaeales archaeon WOR_SM1_79]
MLFKNVMCPVCGSVCDDIGVEVLDGKVNTRNACKMGHSKFQELVSAHRIKKPQVKENGKSRDADWDDALDKAAEILVNAKRPHIFMGTETICEAYAAGIKIAEHIGGTIDGSFTQCHCPTGLGLQEAGMVTATLGVIKNRADLAIYWGTNPMDSHPRHMSHYAIFPRGRFRKRGRLDRKMIIVDPRKTKSSKLADLHVRVKPNKDYELFSAIRATLNEKEVSDLALEDIGINRETFDKMVDMMKNAEFGALCFGLGLASSIGKHRNQENMMKMVQLLNNYTKFIMGINMGHCNVAGFVQVMSYTTGYPYAVDFSRGYPRYGPGEFTNADILADKGIDAMLVLGADLAAHQPRKSVEWMAKIPVISIDISPNPTTMLSDVVLPGVIAGMESEGTFYRMDHVPMKVRKFIDPPFDFTTSDADTLEQLLERIKGLR